MYFFFFYFTKIELNLNWMYDDIDRRAGPVRQQMRTNNVYTTA